MRFDDLFDHFGEIGRYQIMLVFMLMIPELFSDTIALNFLTGRMDHWCYVPELEHLDPELQRNISIPLDDDGEFSQCEMYDLDYRMYNSTEGMWERGNSTQTVECTQGWVYDRSTFTQTTLSAVSNVCSLYMYMGMNQYIWINVYIVLPCVNYPIYISIFLSLTWFVPSHF